MELGLASVSIFAILSFWSSWRFLVSEMHLYLGFRTLISFNCNFVFFCLLITYWLSIIDFSRGLYPCITMDVFILKNRYWLLAYRFEKVDISLWPLSLVFLTISESLMIKLGHPVFEVLIPATTIYYTSHSKHQKHHRIFGIFHDILLILYCY